jgi:hypothetical protein
MWSALPKAQKCIVSKVPIRTTERGLWTGEGSRVADTDPDP